MQAPAVSAQVVTQSLNIPPEDHAAGSEEELSRLREDLRKLREYLRTSVQERKFLLKKIGTLNQKLAEKGVVGVLQQQQQQQQQQLLLLQPPNDQLRHHPLPPGQGTPLRLQDPYPASSRLSLQQEPDRTASPCEPLPDPRGISNLELDLRAATAAFCRRGTGEDGKEDGGGGGQVMGVFVRGAAEGAEDDGEAEKAAAAAAGGATRKSRNYNSLR